MRLIQKIFLILVGTALVLFVGMAQSAMINLGNPMWTPPGGLGLPTVHFKMVIDMEEKHTITHLSNPLLSRDYTCKFFENLRAGPEHLPVCFLELFMEIDPSINQNYRSSPYTKLSPEDEEVLKRIIQKMLPGGNDRAR